MIVTILITTTGCWSRRETQFLTINSALGFDRITVNGKPQILLSVLTLKPSAMAAGGGGMGGTGASRMQVSSGEVISVTGATIEDAIRNWDLRSSRQLFLAHTVVLVIGESMAKEGIAQIIDFCMRDKDVPLRTWVVTCKGSARDALQAQPEFEPLTSTEIANIQYKNTSFVSKTARENVFNVVYDLLTPGREVSLSYMKTFVPPEKGLTMRQQGASGGTGTSGATSGSEGMVQDKTFSLSGTAAFRGDRMVGLLNEVETQGALLIKNQARGGVITVAYNSDHANISYLFRNARTRLKPVISQEGITIEISIKGTGEMIEEQNAVLDITREQNLKELERLINREVEHRCRLAVSRAKSLKSDIFGFGDLIHRADPRVWRQIENQWGDILPTINVKISAHFTVEQPGLIEQPIKIQ